MANLGNTVVNGVLRVNGKFYNNSAMIAYGTCSTAAATAAKEITISDSSWVLKTGNMIMVKFSTTNTASSITLNVNGTGAKQVAYNTSRPYTGNSQMITGYANRSLVYVYDGTYWVWVSSGYDANDNAMPAAISWTGASTAAKTASQNYYTASIGYTLVTFQYTNTAASALTLNINGKGAKPIYINGTVSSSTNYSLPAGCYLVYYDGTNYYFRTDGLITGDITGNANTATRLETSRTINGVSFDGSQDITLPEQTSITGNAGTATKLISARNINLTGDVEGSATFDGSQDITLSCKIISEGQEDNISTITVVTTEEILDNTNYTIPLTYIVGNNSLEIYYMGEKLIKDTHYKEIGDTGSESTTIMFYNWGINVPVDRTIEFLVYSTNVGPLNIDLETFKEEILSEVPEVDTTALKTEILAEVDTKIEDNAYTLPVATADTLGGIKLGSGLTSTDGVVSVDGTQVAVTFSSIVVTKHTCFEMTTISAGSTKTGTYTFTKSGYYPLSLSGWQNTGDTSIQKLYFSSVSLGSVSVYAAVDNADEYANRAGELYVWIVWAK